MNKEELIGKLHMIYAGDRNALEETVGYYDGLKQGIEIVQQENKELKEQLLVTKTNEETFRLEMEDITRALGLAEDTLFDDVKAYARSLKENIACNWKDSCLENAGKIEILENQQKKFIKYLEDYLNLFDNMNIDEQISYDMIEEILSKYKEIIGSDINVGSKGGKE